MKWRGEGYKKELPPAIKGVIVPTAKPKLWKSGKALKNLSLKSISKAVQICDLLVIKFRWLSTTPFGVPSEPLVYNTTAGPSGLSSFLINL